MVCSKYTPFYTPPSPFKVFPMYSTCQCTALQFVTAIFAPPSRGGPFENTGIVIRRRPLIALSLYIHGVPLCKYRPIISITTHLISSRLLIHKLYTFKWPLLLLLAVNCARQSGDRFVMVGDFQLDVTGVAPFI